MLPSPLPAAASFSNPRCRFRCRLTSESALTEPWNPGRSRGLSMSYVIASDSKGPVGGLISVRSVVQLYPGPYLRAGCPAFSCPDRGLFQGRALLLLDSSGWGVFRSPFTTDHRVPFSDTLQDPELLGEGSSRSPFAEPLLVSPDCRTPGIKPHPRKVA